MKKRYRIVPWMEGNFLWYRVQRKGWFIWWTLPGFYSTYGSASIRVDNIMNSKREIS